MANPFSGNVFAKSQAVPHDEQRQGEVYTAAADSDTLQSSAAKKMYLESYGCQMNFSDSEIVASIMAGEGYQPTTQIEEADVVFINTCSIRDHAEQKVRGRLKEFRAVKRKNKDLSIGVLGCMAERLKAKLLEEEQLVDLVVGPDAYKDLPNLLRQVESGQPAVNVLLSREETYADITPVRLGGGGVLAFVTIMRGCDNMCSFCVVPFTRGRERSRDPQTIVDECRDLFARGYREVTLLGQNVDSYCWSPESSTSSGFSDSLHSRESSESTVSSKSTEVRFAELLERVATIDPLLRVRFSTSHPKDITDEVLHTMAAYPNIAKCIHLPVQSGNSVVLRRMNRTYDRAWYTGRLNAIRRIVPECSITSDVIAGFCGETEEQYADTLSMMRLARYSMSFMFSYSERPGTLAARKYPDDVPAEVKNRRLQEIIALQSELSLDDNRADVGKIFEVLVEGPSRKSKEQMCGRNSQNKMCVFDGLGAQPGEYVKVRVDSCTQATLLCSRIV
ncbi:MAG: tRNA (N6-isopentenyl adenosine(37)-C2)-methylthiotransferase MiaB [Sphingomonadales bacterium]|nr:tRNA (N6-isopentenyl adenosine(37)-C2)-methylthiotransferase MiaB [Sphingomonadales bacterium]